MTEIDTTEINTPNDFYRSAAEALINQDLQTLEDLKGVISGWTQSIESKQAQTETLQNMIEVVKYIKDLEK